MTKRKKTGLLDPEFGVSSQNFEHLNLVSEAVELMQYRVNQMKKLTDADIRKARLLQLKYKMNSYLKDQSYESEARFSEFLEIYVDVLYKKRLDFAMEVGISGVVLSQFINGHREPNMEFVSKLTIHALNTYKSVGSFSAALWFEVFYKDKLHEAVHQFNEKSVDWDERGAV